MQMAVLRRFQHELTAIPDDQGLVLSGASASGAGTAIGCAVRTHRECCECIYVKWNFWDHPRVDPARTTSDQWWEGAPRGSQTPAVVTPGHVGR